MISDQSNYLQKLAGNPVNHASREKLIWCATHIEKLEYSKAFLEQKYTKDFLKYKGQIMALAELLARLEKDKAAAIAEVKGAADKELADLTAAGRLLSESDAAALKAELAKNGLDANGNLIAVATA